ncbi:MAG: tyrosine-type recombinase/integrase, partial [Lachnospiraceae bacterium]
MASIRKRGKGYQITISNGRDIHGKQIIETATFIPDPDKTDKQNQRSLERFVMDFEDKVKNGKYLDGEKMTFADFSDKWFREYADIQLEDTTTDIYRILLNTHILPAIGHLKLAKVQPAHLNKLYTDMLENRKDNKEGGYSPTTIKRVHALASSIFSTAVQWNILLDNPCERVRPPKQTKNSNDVQFFTPKESEAFLAELDIETKQGQIQLQHNIFFHLSLFCGLRRGEAVALLWSDINFENHTVNISKSTGIVKGKPYTKPPKNNTSIRTITVPNHIIRMLKRYRMEYNTYRLSIGNQW